MLLATLVVPLSLAASVSAAAVSPFFPANLAVRFSSEKQAGDSIVSRAQKKAALAIAKRDSKKLDGSEDLVALLASANAVLFGAKASASATAMSGAMATSAPSPSAMAAAAGASASAGASKDKAKRDIELVLQTIHNSNWEDLDARLLCPATLTACPILPSGGGFECIDIMNELESCGGCLVKGEGEDCTELRRKGALGVGCQAGQCQAFACAEGYKLYEDSKGRSRCRKARTQVL